MADDDRLEREAQFHDERFSSPTSRSSDEFYTITGSSNTAYLAMIDAIPPGARCLEIGCGPGSVAGGLALRGVSVTSIDISPAAINLARTHAAELGYQNVDFHLMDAENLSFDDQYFDAVVGKGILHHLDLDPALESIARVLKSDGFAAFREPMGHNPVVNLYRRMTPTERTVDEHPLKRNDLRDFRRFFDEVDVDFFHLMSLASIPFRRTKFFAQLLQRLDRMDQRLLAKREFIQNLSWIVTIQLRSPVSSPSTQGYPRRST